MSAVKTFFMRLKKKQFDERVLSDNVSIDGTLLMEKAGDQNATCIHYSLLFFLRKSIQTTKNHN